jgi:hypothetical protein
MRRFLPKSLIGQIALVMAAALLVAQTINFGLIFTERQRVSRYQIEGPAVSRFVQIAQRLAPLAASGRTAQLPQRGRRGRYSLDRESLVPAGASDTHLLERLRESAAASGLVLRDARAAISDEVPVPTPGCASGCDPTRKTGWTAASTGCRP